MYAIQNAFCRERTYFRGFIERIPNFESAHSFDELLQEFVVDLVGDKKSFRGNARLTGVDRACFHARGHGRFKIGARHDNEGIASAELEHAFLDLARSNAGDSTAGAIA